MKTYSVIRMRKERQEELRWIITFAVFCLICAALFGALWKALDGVKAPFLFSGVFLLLFLFLMGFYLLASDEKRLLKKTVYGLALTYYGKETKTDEPGIAVLSVMREIDEEARAMRYECSGFALMENWLVIYVPLSPTVFGRDAVMSLPVRRSSLKRAVWEKRSQRENDGYMITFEISWLKAPWITTVWEQSDIQALRDWSAVQEKRI